MKKRGRQSILSIILLVILAISVYSESFNIENLGLPGFDDVNNEYTSSRTVVLKLNISSNATVCGFSNDDNNSYGIWEPCTETKFWLLSQNSGNKTVFIKINHSDFSIAYYNDSIYYNYTGTGLDTTPPTKPIFVTGNYSNNNRSQTVEWEGSTDPESEILGIPIIYEYRVLLNAIENLTWTKTTENKITYQINTTQDDNVTFEVKATNSAGLTNTSSITINMDLVPPTEPNITSSLNTTSWHNDTTVFLNWSGIDDKSVMGYSYVFTQNQEIDPDSIPEGDINDLENHINKTFNLANDGIYYFKIRTIDSARNPSNITEVSIKIDQTPPSRPEIIDSFQLATGTLNITWYPSSDLSGIDRYEVELSDIDNFSYINYSANFTTNKANFSNINHADYYIRIRAQNNVGLVSVWSNEDEIIYDSTPPTITFQSPGNDIIARNNPILILKTDEDSTCYYNENNEFIYTGKRYHETRIILSDFDNITCIDEAGNKLQTILSLGSLSVSTTPSISNPIDVSAYSNMMKKFYITTTHFGFEKQDFEVYLDNVSIPFSIFPTEEIGNYSFTFQSPNEPGEYELKINDLTIDLTVNDLNFTTRFETSQTISDYENSFQTVKGKLGIYTFGFISNSVINGFESDANFLSSTSSSKNQRLLFFNTKISNQNKKEYLYYTNDFLNNNPTINDYSFKEKKNKIIISNPKIRINTTADYGSGLMNLKIQLVKKSTTEKTITIRKQDSIGNSIKVYD
ncbi:hypothetical protein C0585_07310 [Candidatus Woesearchaeota archaeon]|nr:MAG: hypothetical protein C0585_07310 [Candidatus Woesearchaeota archaeon]